MQADLVYNSGPSFCVLAGQIGSINVSCSGDAPEDCFDTNGNSLLLADGGSFA